MSSIHSDDNIDLPSFRNLHDRLYYRMRDIFCLSAQMTQFVMRTVLAHYSTLVIQIRNLEKPTVPVDSHKPRGSAPRVVDYYEKAR